jgi:hypothetical protein
MIGEEGLDGRGQVLVLGAMGILLTRILFGRPGNSRQRFVLVFAIANVV